MKILFDAKARSKKFTSQTSKYKHFLPLRHQGTKIFFVAAPVAKDLIGNAFVEPMKLIKPL